MRKFEEILDEFHDKKEGERHPILMSLANACYRDGYTDEDSLRERLLELWEQGPWGDVNTTNAQNDCRSTAKHMVEQAEQGGWQPPKESVPRKTQTQIRKMVDSHDPYRKQWIEDLMNAHSAEITADVTDDEIGRYDNTAFTEQMSKDYSTKSLETVKKLTPLDEGEYLYYATPMMQKVDTSYLDHTYTPQYDMDDIWHPNPLCSKECKKNNIKRIRYICAEIDECLYEPLVAGETDTYKKYARMRREQMVFWNAVKDRLPVACMTSSGKKSVHVLMRVDTSMEEFERLRPSLVSIYSALHIDTAGCTVSQLTRTPWGIRVFLQGDKADIPLSDFMKWKMDTKNKDGKIRNDAEKNLIRNHLDSKNMDEIHGKYVYVVQQCLYLNETVNPMTLQEFIAALEGIESMYVPQVDNLCEKAKMDGKVPYLTNEVFQDFLKLNTPKKKEMEIWLDDITRKLKFGGFRTDDANNLINNLQDAWYEYFETKEGMPNIEKWRGCIKETATINKRNPVTDWMETLQWDGKDRLVEASSILGIDNDEFSQVLLHKWLLQCVAMAYNDGVNPIGADGVLTLCGGQGIGKTSFFRHLVPKDRQYEWWGEGISIDTGNKDDQISFTEYWIAEMGEVDSTISREQRDLKAWITKPFDTIRLPYAEHKEKYRRHLSWCATVNDPEFLKDPTGNRRWWTITLEHRLDLEKLRTFDSEQLWAQIWLEYDQSKVKDSCFRLTQDEQETLKKRNLERMKQPEICDVLREKYDFCGEKLADGSYKDGSKETNMDIARYIFPDREPGRYGEYGTGKIADALRKMGTKATTVGKRCDKGFFMPRRVSDEERKAEKRMEEAQMAGKSFVDELNAEFKKNEAELKASVNNKNDPLFGDAPKEEPKTKTPKKLQCSIETKRWLDRLADDLKTQGMQNVQVDEWAEWVSYVDEDGRSMIHRYGNEFPEEVGELPF